MSNEDIMKRFIAALAVRVALFCSTDDVTRAHSITVEWSRRACSGDQVGRYGDITSLARERKLLPPSRGPPLP